MRLIDADALAANFENAAKFYMGPASAAFHEALEHLQNAPTVTDINVGRWIPVAEALPETIACNAGTAYSEAVIVWTDGRKAMVAVWNGEDFLCAADYWEAWDEHITHWMPLPRPLPEVPQP